MHSGWVFIQQNSRESKTPAFSSALGKWGGIHCSGLFSCVTNPNPEYVPSATTASLYSDGSGLLDLSFKSRTGEDSDFLPFHWHKSVL